MAEQMQPIQSVQEITEPLAIKDQGDIPRFNEASARNLKDMRDFSKNLNDDFIPKWNASRGAVNIVVTNIKAIQDAPTQAANAAKSASAALTSQNAAKASENAAKASQNAAKTSETNAKTSETTAKASQNAAKVSETNAKNSENAALASKNAAKTSETNAANSATAANNSKNAAATSATNAANSATAALASQNAAKASENAALASKNAAKTSETNAKTSETAAKASQDSAKVSETNSKASENAALASKNAAKTSETNAANSATAANSSKTAAATSATNAANSATAALASKNAAKSSQDAAKTSQTAVEAIQSKVEAIAGGHVVVENRKVLAGTGLSGGGDLSADRTLTVKYGTSQGTACQGNDARLSNARTPAAHKATHKTGGTDAMTPADIGALASNGNAVSASKLQAVRTIALTGNITGSGNFDGSRNLSIQTKSTSIELTPPTTATNGGFIDFHYAGSTADYTSRIIEDASGHLKLYCDKGFNFADTMTCSGKGNAVMFGGNIQVPGNGLYFQTTDSDGKTKRNWSILRAYGQDGYGCGIALTGGSLTLIGGGEAPFTIQGNETYLQEFGGRDSENAGIVADGHIYFMTGLQAWANRKKYVFLNNGTAFFPGDIGIKSLALNYSNTQTGSPDAANNGGAITFHYGGSSSSTSNIIENSSGHININAVNGVTFNGPVSGELLNIDEKVQALGNITGAKTINFANGNCITATVTGATTFTFSGARNGKARSALLILTNGGKYAITWPTAVKWPGDVAPVLTAAGVDIISLVSVNGGTTWYGVPVAMAYK